MSWFRNIFRSRSEPRASSTKSVPIISPSEQREPSPAANREAIPSISRQRISKETQEAKARDAAAAQALLDRGVANAEQGNLNLVTHFVHQYGLGTLDAIAYAPDGRTIATAGGTGVLLWDTETNQVRHLVSKPAFRCLAFSQHGSQILAGSDDYTARLFDVGTGTELLTFSGHAGPVITVAFSPDERTVLTGSQDDTVRLWDAKTGTEIRSSSFTGGIHTVAFSPDGKRILVASRYYVFLGDAGMGAEIWLFRAPTVFVFDFASFTPNGKDIVTGGYKTAYFIDTATGSNVRHLSDENGISFLVYSPDQTRFFTQHPDEGTVTMWNAATYSKIRRFSWHASPVKHLALSPDGKSVLTTGRDGTIKCCSADNGVEIRTLTGFSLGIDSMAYSPDGNKILTNGGEFWTGAQLWDVNTGTVIRSTPKGDMAVRRVTFSPDGKTMLTSSETEATLWDAGTAAVMGTFRHIDHVIPVAFSPDGKTVLTGSSDGTAKLWNAKTTAEIQTYRGHTGMVTSVVFSPDGKTVLTGSEDHTAKLWDAKTGAEILTVSGHTKTITSVTFSADGREMLTGSRDGTVRMWKIGAFPSFP